MKRILSFLLVLMMVLGMAVSVSATEIVASGTCGDNLTWTLDDEGTLTISGEGAMYDYYANNTEESNSSPWAMSNSIQKIVIEDGVTTIGDEAFAGCSVQEVSIPNSVVNIGKNAFHLCSELTAVEIPGSVLSIESYAFYQCEALETVKISDGVQSMGHGVFISCTKLSSITIPESVSAVEANLFFACTNLSQITFRGDAPEVTVTSYPGTDIFQGVTATAYYPAGNETWTEEVMQNYGGTITWVAYEVPAEVVAEGTCGDNLTWVLTDDGTLTISGEGTMDSFAYGDAPWYSYQDSIECVVIENGVTSIGEYAFMGCGKLMDASIPESVTSIDSGAFMGCTSLTEIFIPAGVESLADDAFRRCDGLRVIEVDENNPNYCSDESGVLYNKEMTGLLQAPSAISGDYTVPAGVEYIASYAFYYCTGLTGVTIPESTASIPANAFSNCTALAGIWADANNAVYCSDGYGVLYNKMITELIRAPGALSGSYTIPESVVKIGESAFEWCTQLVGVTIPEGITTISANAFNSCSSLTEVTIPDSVTTIGACAFNRCTSLEEIILPNSVTTLEMAAFQMCTSLKKVVLSANVATIGNSLFSQCTSLTDITIPESVTGIDNYAFLYCTALTGITFRGDVPTIGDYACVGVTATAYYPADNATWTEDVMQNYGGTITWVSYIPVPAKPYKITNTVSGVHVYWKAVDGAVKYGLWRSETGKDGTYKWIANPTVPHFTDTKVESGKTYYYKVTAMNGAGIHSDKSEAIGITYVSTPDITTRENVAAGINLGWNKIEGATGYAIYRKSYSGTDAWVRVGTISGNNTFTWTDTSVKNNNGTAYKYTIRALAGSNMKTLSGCRNAGRTMVRLSSQTLKTAAKASATSIKCSWTTSKVVTGYEIRFMVDGEVYKTFTVGNYKTGVKTFTGLKAGQTYTIQVRTYKKVDGVGSFYSDWSTARYVTL